MVLILGLRGYNLRRQDFGRGAGNFKMFCPDFAAATGTLSSVILETHRLASSIRMRYNFRAMSGDDIERIITNTLRPLLPLECQRLGVSVRDSG